MCIKNILTKQFHIKEILKEPLVCFQNQSKDCGWNEYGSWHVQYCNKGICVSAFNL